MFTKREANICVNSLDAVGGMDGKISVEDLTVSIKRAMGDGPTLLDEFEVGKDMYYFEGGVVSKAEEEPMIKAEVLEVDAVEPGIIKPAVKTDPVSVVVPDGSSMTTFSDRYKILVLEPSALTTKKRVLYTEPTSISGEILMLRFSKEISGGISVEGLDDAGAKDGFFEADMIKAMGYGDIEGKSDSEIAEICKTMARGMSVENDGMVLMQLK